MAGKAAFVFITSLFTLASGLSSSQCSKVVLYEWCSSKITEGSVQIFQECERNFTYLERRCRVNEIGQFCGSSLVDNLDNIILAKKECLNGTSASCTNECRKNLEFVRENIGCCINEIVNITVPVTIHSPLFEYSIWQSCGVNLPAKNCMPSRLTKYPKPKNTQLCSVQEFLQKRYKNECKDSLVKALVNDYDAHGCQELSAGLYKYCGVTEEGIWCIDQFLTNVTVTEEFRYIAEAECSNDGSCPSECLKALQGIKNILGCCINNLFNNTYLKLTYPDSIFTTIVEQVAVWNACGIAYPDSCVTKTYNGGSRIIESVGAMVIFLLTLFVQVFVY